MKKSTSTLAGLLSATMLSVSFPAVTSAAMVDSAQLLASQQASDQQTLDAFMARDQVRDQLVALGVSPEIVQQRLQGLTDEEARQLAQQIDELPAGAGLIEVVGIVFVVLIVLELVGVTDVFKAF